MPLSQSQNLRYFAGALGGIAFTFGINGLLRPLPALSNFNIAYPTDPAGKNAVDSLMTVYGIRDIFQGFMIVASAYYGSTPVLGWSLFGCGVIAAVDGWVCVRAGNGGEWNHFGFVPLGMGTGLALLGALD